MGNTQSDEIRDKLIHCQSQNRQKLIGQTIQLIKSFDIAQKEKFTKQVLNLFKKQSSPQNIQDNIKYEQSAQQNSPAKGDDKAQLFGKQIDYLKTIQKKLCKTINEVMSTKKLYHIRQSFRKLILSILKLQNLQFYVFHDSGKVQFHDFKQNYITQILDSNEKKKLIQMALANSSSTIQSMKFQDNNIFSKLFSIPMTSQKNINSKYLGEINKSNQKYSNLMLYTFLEENHLKVNQKIAEKTVSISMIQIQEESQYNIAQYYSKQLLDILQILVNQSQDRLTVHLNSLLSLLDNNDSLQQIVKNLTKKKVYQYLMQYFLKYQEFRYDLLQRIRMYSKYISEENIIFMDFDQTGYLNFLANNKKQSQLNTILAKLSFTDDLCIQKIFPNNEKLQQHIKKAMLGLTKNKKLYEIQNGMKSRLTRNEDNQISRIQILIQQPSQIQSYCSSSTLSKKSLKKKHSFNSSSDKNSLEGSKSSKKLFSKIQTDNPGIMKQGWLNMFMKDDEIKRNSSLMSKKKRALFATSQQSQLLSKSQQFLQSQQNINLKDFDINSPDLNLFELDYDYLEAFIKKVFSALKFFKRQQLNKQYFNNFLSDLHQGYSIHDNPFHNFTHGTNVMHTCYLISNLNKNQEILTPLKIFSTVLSGLCHDVGHTGRTNAFQIGSKSKKALTYNDISPLQNFHCFFTFQILRRAQNNFLLQFPIQQQVQIRKDIISNILYTDIKQHFPLIKKFKSIQYKPEDNKLPSNQDLLILMGMIVHTSDFGGSAKQFQICREWSRRVNVQFINQYQLQAQLNIPQTPFFKDLHVQKVMAKNQMGFLKVIVFPLYQVLNQFYQQEPIIKKLKNFAQQNIKCWQNIHLETLKTEQLKNAQNIQKKQ